MAGVRQTRPDGVVQTTDAGVVRTVLDEPVGSPFIWWPIDAGSGTAVDDELGTHGGSITGATWTSGTYMGEWALDGDGSDDWIESDTWGTFGSGLTSDLAIAATVAVSADSNGYLVANDDSGSGGPVFFFGTRGFITNTSGQFGFWVSDDGGTNDIAVSTDTTYDDGARRRVVLNKTGNTESGLAIYVDGSSVATSNVRTGTLSSASDFTQNFGILSQEGGTNPSDATIDDLVVYQTSLTTAQITDDYQRQPWS